MSYCILLQRKFVVKSAKTSTYSLFKNRQSTDFFVDIFVFFYLYSRWNDSDNWNGSQMIWVIHFLSKRCQFTAELESNKLGIYLFKFAHLRKVIQQQQLLMVVEVKKKSYSEHLSEAQELILQTTDQNISDL